MCCESVDYFIRFEFGPGAEFTTTESPVLQKYVAEVSGAQNVIEAKRAASAPSQPCLHHATQWEKNSVAQLSLAICWLDQKALSSACRHSHCRGS